MECSLLRYFCQRSAFLLSDWTGERDVQSPVECTLCRRFIAVMAPTLTARSDLLSERCLVMSLLAGVWLLSVTMSTPLFYVAGTMTLFELPDCDISAHVCTEAKLLL